MKRQDALVLALAFALYGVGFLVLRGPAGGEVIDLALLPVGAIAALFGPVAGVAAGIAAVGTNALLFGLAGEDGIDALVRDGGLGSALIVLAGALVGRLGSIERALRRSNVALDAERARLREELLGREEYMSVLAHELRNPLVGIRTAARALAGHLPDESRTVTESIAAEAAQGLALLDGLTDVASLESGRMRSVLVPTDLARLLRDAVRGKEDLGQRVTLAGAEDEVVVLGDERRIRQVIDNLLSNAAKYSPADTPIEVALGRSPDDGSAIVVVRDHGPGVPPSERGRLFQKFARLSTAGGTRGSGLGLFICRGIVQDHDGNLTADWPPGGGTAFSFTLPVVSQPRLPGAWAP